MNKKLPIVALATLLLAGCGTSINTMSDKAVPTVMVNKEVGKFKDGSYQAVGKYTSPNGPEQIGIDLTVKDGKVSKAKAKVMATSPKSMRFQTMFADNFGPLVIGKSLSEIKLDKVSGSSLTPSGFMDALGQIEQKASM